MITAVDTSVLLDIFLQDERRGVTSRNWLVEAYDAGAIIVSTVVYAELAPAFPDREALDRALREVNVVVSPIDSDMAHDAARRWARYREAGGSRDRIITDFLIGAHAAAASDRFLTRDRGFFLSYFPELDPED